MSDAVVGSPTKPPLPPLNITQPRRDSKDSTRLENLLDNRKEKTKLPELCSCWCNGWAEIHVRRPSGEVSWITRIQNASLTSESHAEFPLSDLTTLFHPDKEDLDEEKPLESLENATLSSETFSIFSRGRRSSAGSSSSVPTSPVKEAKQPDFPDSSPLSNNDSSKQSCDPIPEVDDEEDQR